MIFLEKVCAALNEQHVQFAIVGGYAVAMHGAVRGTVDIDFVVKWGLETLSNAEEALKQLGLVSKHPICATDVYHFRKEYIENRNLIAWNFYNPANQVEQVDIIINFDLSDDMIIKMDVGSSHIPVLDIQSLISMKQKSGREQDLLDIDALKRLTK